jgi:AraC-like DNA-binding protein
MPSPQARPTTTGPVISLPSRQADSASVGRRNGASAIPAQTGNKSRHSGAPAAQIGKSPPPSRRGVCRGQRRRAVTPSQRYRRAGIPPEVPPRERFDYWRTWCAEALPVPVRLEPVEAPPPDYRASTDTLSAGDLDFVEAHYGPAAARWRGRAARDRLHLVIGARSAGGAGGCNDAPMPLSRGYAALLGRTDGWWRAPDGLRRMQLSLPRAVVPVSDRELERLTEREALLTDPVFTGLVRPALIGMAGHLAQLANAEGTELAAVWTTLLAMLVRSLAGRDLAGADLAPARRLAAQRYISSHLADPSLSPDTVAVALRISRRSLYACFPGEHGVAGEIRRLRLSRARALLHDPQRTGPIAAIAAEVGLANAAHFSRLFRAAYGQSPRDARALAAPPAGPG